MDPGLLRREQLLMLSHDGEGDHRLETIGPEEGESRGGQGKVPVLLHDGEGGENRFGGREGGGDPGLLERERPLLGVFEKEGGPEEDLRSYGQKNQEGEEGGPEGGPEKPRKGKASAQEKDSGSGTEWEGGSSVRPGVSKGTVKDFLFSRL